MVRRAQEKYPDLAFIRGNAEHFETGKRYSAVFSNAALHWIKDAGSVAASVWNALEEGGRFVAEFGGKGNVETIVNAIGKVLSRDYGIDADSRNPWYFPSIGEYSRLLEKQGFRVIYALHFDRPTPLEDGENGLMHWLNGLAADEFFKGLDDSQRKIIYGQIAEEIRADLYHNGIWSADYKRLRIAAIKP
ncbi:hypothetical protein PF010_g2655 [Phytophthora fragariae]|uniref:Methyltransferase type 11 domain-containing protein n=1 Tax=Phytophthora fragariae TaxID=53985 RepID=A0A6G0LX21_9STRA|nr:hypothetical protein PF010_g2655 [Phytophthora fragariae]